MNLAMQKQYAYFSAAIRDGAAFHDQGFYALKNQRNKTCAIGAGLEAMCVSIPVFINNPDGECEFAKKSLIGFPYLTAMREWFPCPEPKCVAMHACLFDAILDLNDTHRWSREAIADWLYAEEEKLGFTTFLEAEPFKPEMVSESSTVKATVPSSCLTN